MPHCVRGAPAYPRLPSRIRAHPRFCGTSRRHRVLDIHRIRSARCNDKPTRDSVSRASEASRKPVDPEFLVSTLRKSTSAAWGQSCGRLPVGDLDVPITHLIDFVYGDRVFHLLLQRPPVEFRLRPRFYFRCCEQPSTTLSSESRVVKASQVRVRRSPFFATTALDGAGAGAGAFFFFGAAFGSDFAAAFAASRILSRLPSCPIPNSSRSMSCAQGSTLINKFVVPGGCCGQLRWSAPERRRHWQDEPAAPPDRRTASSFLSLLWRKTQR